MVLVLVEAVCLPFFFQEYWRRIPFNIRKKKCLYHFLYLQLDAGAMSSPPPPPSSSASGYWPPHRHITLNSKLLLVQCRFCPATPSIRAYGSHVMQVHKHAYSRGLCHFCGVFTFRDKSTGDAHKLQCLMDKILV